MCERQGPATLPFFLGAERGESRAAPEPTAVEEGTTVHMRSNHPIPRALRKGYTLIEVLIVVTILGLAGALLVPYLSSKGDFDTQSAVRTLIADISFAQSDALANQGFRSVYFYPDGTGWCLVRASEDSLGYTMLAPGFYYIAVTGVGMHAIEEAGASIWPDLSDPGLTVGGNERFLGNWAGQGAVGDYHVRLHAIGGNAVPAPGSLALLGVAALVRRRRR